VALRRRAVVAVCAVTLGVITGAAQPALAAPTQVTLPISGVYSTEADAHAHLFVSQGPGGPASLSWMIRAPS